MAETGGSDCGKYDDIPEEDNMIGYSCRTQLYKCNIFNTPNKQDARVT